MSAKSLLIIVCSGLLPSAGFAENVPLDNVVPRPETMRTMASRAKDLSLPSEVSTFGFFHAPQMALYKPEGDGPFPALVLVHQCGGINKNVSMLEWAKKAVARDYVVLQLDLLGQRNVDQLCSGPKGGVRWPRGVKDVFQAAAHLAKLPYVDAKRVGIAGYSWGAIVAYMASSQSWAAALSEGTRFAAAVSFYPYCGRTKPPPGLGPDAVFDPAPTDIERPLLVLMGDADTETPPNLCVARLEAAKAQGAPVDWYLFKDTTHCFDCSHLHNFTKVDTRGAKVIYKYDADTTADSEKRMFDFLARKMTPGG